MKDGMPPYAMKNPCAAPATAPMARQRMTATGHGRSFLTMNTAAIEPMNAVSDPTDRSM